MAKEWNHEGCIRNCQRNLGIKRKGPAVREMSTIITTIYELQLCIRNSCVCGVCVCVCVFLVATQAVSLNS